MYICMYIYISLEILGRTGDDVRCMKRILICSPDRLINTLKNRFIRYNCKDDGVIFKSFMVCFHFCNM
jgi:hypothetical protein